MRKTLAELKGESVQLRDKIERYDGTFQDVHDLNEKRRTIENIEEWLLKAIVFLMIVVLSGCHVGAGVGADFSAYWPEIKTAKGGEFGDPDESRKQTTQHTVGIASHNGLPMVGGGK